MGHTVGDYDTVRKNYDVTSNVHVGHTHDNTSTHDEQRHDVFFPFPYYIHPYSHVFAQQCKLY